MRADEARAKKYQDEHVRKELQAHQEKQDRIRQMAMDDMTSVKSQMEEKRQKNQKDREDNIRMAQEFQRDAQAALDEEKKKQQDRREKAKENQAFLLAQMASKSTIVPPKFGHEQMIQAEKSINRDRLERAR